MIFTPDDDIGDISGNKIDKSKKVKPVKRKSNKNSNSRFINNIIQASLKPTYLRNLRADSKTVSFVKGQGRKQKELKDVFAEGSTGRTDYRRCWDLWTSAERACQTSKGLNAVLEGTQPSILITILEGGVIHESIDKLSRYIQLNDMIFISKSKTPDQFDPDRFAIIRACENDEYSNIIDEDRRLNRETIEGKRAKVLMIGSKLADNFKGKWYVHSILNLTTFERIFDALRRRGKLPLEDFLLSGQKPDEYILKDVEELPIRRNRLTGRQLEVVEQWGGSIDQQGIHCIKGPPGTGKTTTLEELIYCHTRLVNTGETIVTCPGNALVADLAERFTRVGGDVLPPGGYLMVVGHPSLVQPKAHRYALFTYLSVTLMLMKRIYYNLDKYNKLLEKRSGFTQINQIVEQTINFEEDIKKMQQLPCPPTKIINYLEEIKDSWENLWTNHVLEQVSGQTSKENIDIRRKLTDCIKEASLWSNRNTLTKILLEGAYLVLCTNSQAMSVILCNWPFKYVLADEAAQCLEPETLLAWRPRMVKCCLIGDFEQLSAIVQNQEAKEAGFGRPMMRRLDDAGYPILMLDEQYRMDAEISAFPRRYIYNNELRDADCIKDRAPFPLSAYEIIPIVGEEQVCKEAGTNQSIYNLIEAEAIREWIASNIDIINQRDIAVITAYQGQRDKLQSILSEYPGITIQTIDGYQGQESPVVILSLVRSGGKTIGFTDELERMNVALTRAQRCFRIIGDIEHFANKSKSKHWLELYNDAQSRGCICDGKM
tara:strand:+ start:3808 stop:6117 length:2310 start_codon:yes stop_codon:yes gene_type:complete